MKNLLVSIALVATLGACGEAPKAQSATAQPISATSSGGSLVNGIRAKAGLPALRRNAQLDRAALAHAKDMAANSFMSHTGSDGSDLRTRVERTGYRWCTLAENVARGHRSDASAVEGWRTSAGHYRNMVKRKAKDYGMANVNGFRVLVLGASRC